MQAGDDDRRVDEAEEEAADRAEGRVAPVDAVGEPLGEDAGDGADRDEGEEAGDEEGDERGEEEVDRAREPLVKLLFDEAHDVGDGERRDDLRLVADLRDVHAEHVPVLDFGLAGEGGARVPRVEEVPGDHRRAEGCAEVDVAAEALRGGESDEDGERGEGGGRDHVDEVRVVGDPGEHLDDRLRAEEALGGEDVVDRHHEAAGDECGEDRDEDVRDHLDESGEDVAALRGFFLGLILGDFSDAVVGDHVRVDDVDVAGADDDLVHAARGECPLQILVGVEGRLVDLLLVREDEPEACRAMGGGGDVGGPADGFDDFGCHLGVIHCHSTFLSRWTREGRRCHHGSRAI